MNANQPLTITVEQAAEVLGVGRSTAYELVRSGDLKCIRLRRRIVIPVAHLAERLGVERADIWAVLDEFAASEASPQSPSRSATSGAVSTATVVHEHSTALQQAKLGDREDAIEQLRFDL